MEYGFEHYLKAGHGRAYLIAKGDPEKYREKILEACRKDYAFDMQCEGSRAFLTSDLVSLFPDKIPFIEAAVESFKTASGLEWREMNHLSDLLLEFGQRDALIHKLVAIEKEIYSDVSSDMRHELLQAFEYLAIDLMQSGDERDLGILIGKIGRWFLNEEGRSVQKLKSYFMWFDSCAEKRYGSDRFDIARQNTKYPEAVDEYHRIMSHEMVYSRSKEESVAADEVLSWIREDPKIEHIDLRCKGLVRLSSDELIKVAETLMAESDIEVKAGILAVFLTERFKWPLDISILIDLSYSEHERLRTNACQALSFFRSDRNRERGLEILKDGYDNEALKLVIENFREEDEELVLGYLFGIPITSDNEGEWHGIVNAISKRHGDISLSILKWAYESSWCSFCREHIVEDMLAKGSFPEEYREEVKWDANLDIRSMFEE